MFHAVMMRKDIMDNIVVLAYGAGRNWFCCIWQNLYVGHVCGVAQVACKEILVGC